MRILLDTSFLYGLMASHGDSPESVRGILDGYGPELFVSAVSIWEMRLKYRALHPSGDRKSPYNPNDVVAMLRGHQVKFVPLGAHHAACSLETPLPHKDPFDELLLVQAQEEGLSLLTSDRLLAGHPLAITVQPQKTPPVS